MEARHGKENFMNAREVEKVLFELSQIIKDGVHVVNAQGKSIIYNHAMAVLEKTPREAVIGKHFRKVFSHIPLEESTMAKALYKNTPTIEKRQTYLNSFGKEVTTVNTTIPVTDSEGRVIAAIELSRDITDFEKLSNQILDLHRESAKPGHSGELKLKRYDFSDLIGKNEGFQEVVETARMAATSDASVFIVGETGTGKELFAQSIHFDSKRKERPFLAQNCAAIPETLLEGMLFGTAKGGFTGAVDREGLFEQASGGTLLLDEINAMPFELQGKLLRVLQEDYIRRVGGTKDIPVDVRIIATVNEDPAMLIQTGRLRKDLYYRLNIINLSITPLRERKDDIPLLVDEFIIKHNDRLGKEVWMASESALEKMLEHDFPGNVRELENLIQSAISLAGKEHVLTDRHIRISTLGRREAGNHQFQGADLEKGLDSFLSHVEESLIREAMLIANGNITKAAQRLKIKRQTLQHKLKKMNGESGENGEIER